MSASATTTSPTTRFAANRPWSTAGDTPAMMTLRRPSNSTTVSRGARFMPSSGLTHTPLDLRYQIGEVERLGKQREWLAVQSLFDHSGRSGAGDDDSTETIWIVLRHRLHEREAVQIGH